MAASGEKLTPEVQETIVRLIRSGNFRETAAAAAGITSRSLRAWMARGAQEAEGKYHDFAAAMDQAEAQAEADALEVIDSAGRSDWKAVSWRLERRHPTRWGDRRRVEIEGEVSVSLDDLSALQRAATANECPTGAEPTESDEPKS